MIPKAQQTVISLRDALSKPNRRLPPEQETGNVEYKLLLHNNQPDRLEHYLSQLKWRLAEHRHCLYMVGVEDDGRVVGVRRAVFEDTMEVLWKMVGRVAGGEMRVSEFEVGPGRWCAECVITSPDKALTSQTGDAKVLVVGAKGVGKSTLIGVLACGELDNGRGSARTLQLHHRHELLSGHTQSRSYQYVNIPTGGRLRARDSADDLDAFASSVCQEANSDPGRVVQMIDTPGFPSLTSLACLTSVVPPDLVLLVDSNSALGEFYLRYESVCRFFGIKTARLLTHSSCDGVDLTPTVDLTIRVDLTTGYGLDKLSQTLHLLPLCDPPNRDPPNPNQDPYNRDPYIQDPYNRDPHNTTHIHIQPGTLTIEQVYYGEQVGLIVSGLVRNADITQHDRLLISPLDSHATVNSIHRMRAQVPSASPGQYVTFSLAVPEGVHLERGMVLSVDSICGICGDGICGDSICVKMTNTFTLSLNRHSSLTHDAPQHGTVLMNGAKYGGQLVDQNTIVLSASVPVHPNAPCIFVAADTHQILCAYATI